MIVILNNHKDIDFLDYKTRQQADLIIAFTGGKSQIYKSRWGRTGPGTFREGIVAIEQTMLYNKTV